MVTLPDGRVFVAEGPADIPRSTTRRPAPSAPRARVVGRGGRSGRPPRRPGRPDRGSGAWTPGARSRPGTRSAARSHGSSLPEPLRGATVLDDGRVLLIGMCRGRPAGWTGVYDPATGVTTPAPGTRPAGPHRLDWPMDGCSSSAATSATWRPPRRSRSSDERAREVRRAGNDRRNRLRLRRFGGLVDVVGCIGANRRPHRGRRGQPRSRSAHRSSRRSPSMMASRGSSISGPRSTDKAST